MARSLMYEREDIDVTKLYGKEATLSKEDFISTYHINSNGLSSNQAESKLNKYGTNEIKQAKPKNGIIIFYLAYLHLLIVF